MATDSMTVKITSNDTGNPVGKLADAELHFTGGPLEGLKLIRFGIWERRGASARNVTFPARQYSVKGDKRTFTLSCVTPSVRLRDARCNRESDSGGGWASGSGDYATLHAHQSRRRRGGDWVAE
jgi:hypothetical protein